MLRTEALRTLGFDPLHQPTGAELKIKRRQLAMSLHPDHQHGPRAEEKLKIVNVAFDILTGKGKAEPVPNPKSTAFDPLLPMQLWAHWYLLYVEPCILHAINSNTAAINAFWRFEMPEDTKKSKSQ